MAYNWKKFLHGLENYGVAMADGALSAVGATNVIKPDMYIGENKDKWSKAGDIYGGITQAALPLALNIIAPGSGAIASTVQKGVSKATNPNEEQQGNTPADTLLKGQELYTKGQDMYNSYKDMQNMKDTLNIIQSMSSLPMAYGGLSTGMPELEKQEVLRTPQGQIRQVNAPPHNQGGTGPMNLPGGTNVLSDRLKASTGKTFAEEGAKYDTKKWEDVLKTSNDPFKKKTAERMIAHSNKQLTKLYAEQEIAKANDAVKTYEKQFGKGGTVQYPNGGTVKSAYNPNMASNDKDFQAWYNANTIEGKNNIPYSDSLDYDYYSYYKNGDYKSYKGGHFPDTYKKPNHPTFSNESIYSTPENPGGSWNGDTYIPAKMGNGGSVNFKSPAAYKAWLAYGHATGVFENTPGNQNVSIKGQHKDVKHMPYGGTTDYPLVETKGDQPITSYDPSLLGMEGSVSLFPNGMPTTPEQEAAAKANMQQQIYNWNTFQQPGYNMPQGYDAQNQQQTNTPMTNNQRTMLDKFKAIKGKVGDQMQNVNPYFTAATFGNMLGPIYDIYRGGRGGDQVNFDRINPELVDYSQARKMGVQETNRGFNATENYLKNATGGNAGAYLANVGAASAMRDRQNQNMISQSIENERNVNAQISNQAKAQNAGIQMQESVARQQEKDIAKNTLAKGLYNFGASLNQYGNDMMLKGNEPVLKALIDTGDYQYVYSKSGKPIGIKSNISKKITGFTGLSSQQQKELDQLMSNLPK